MGIVGGLDVHRAQITYDYLDSATGEVEVGRIVPATRPVLREWLSRFEGVEAVFATEGCTGWRFVVEELGRAGVEAHLAEPADTATLRGRKKRAKTDRADARHLRQLLVEGRLPESWIAPSHVLETRVKGRLYVALMDQRRAWQQRIHAQLFHQGVEKRRSLLAADQRAWLAEVDLSDAGRQLIEVALRVTDALTAEIEPLRAELQTLARSQPGPRALREGIWGIGPLTAPIIWAEMGDCRRFSSSDQAVRHTGLDVTVWSSDGRRSPGHLSRQGPPVLRWALFEAAFLAARKISPDHDYYLSVKERLGANRAALSVARKLARRVHHILRDLGDKAWEEAA
ncbi:MAG: IS110 family transposase [Acidimicrobiia bacterium]